MDIALVTPGIPGLHSRYINVPIYPDKYVGPSPGDKVWVIVETSTGYFIDTTTIVGFEDYTLLRLFVIDKYNPGHGLMFGEALFSSFEEAKSVLAQYYVYDHKMYNEILKATEAELAGPNETD